MKLKDKTLDQLRTMVKRAKGKKLGYIRHLLRRGRPA